MITIQICLSVQIHCGCVCVSMVQRQVKMCFQNWLELFKTITDTKNNHNNSNSSIIRYLPSQHTLGVLISPSQCNKSIHFFHNVYGIPIIDGNDLLFFITNTKSSTVRRLGNIHYAEPFNRTARALTDNQKNQGTKNALIPSEIGIHSTFNILQELFEQCCPSLWNNLKNRIKYFTEIIFLFLFFSEIICHFISVENIINCILLACDGSKQECHENTWAQCESIN